jgi:hypothetical protein
VVVIAASAAVVVASAVVVGMVSFLFLFYPIQSGHRKRSCFIVLVLVLDAKLR